MKYKKLKVDNKTPLTDQLKGLGIKSCLDLSKITDLYPLSDYIYDVEDGMKMLGKSPSKAIEELKKSKRRPLTVSEGLALFRKDKKILKNHYIDLGGSRYGSGFAPGLFLAGGKPKLSYDGLVYSYDGWGSASCSSIGNLELGGEDELPKIFERLDELEKFKIQVEKVLKL